jgi:hypothetical protein
MDNAVRAASRPEEHRPLAVRARRRRRRRIEDDLQRVAERPDGAAKNLVRGEYASSGQRPILDIAGQVGIRGALDEMLPERRAALGCLVCRPDD